MPGKERTRRPGADQLDLTDLLGHTGAAPGSEAEAQQSLSLTAARLAATLGDTEEKAWQGSPYAWVRHIPAARKSRVAERLVAGYLSTTGTVVGPASGTGHSFTVAGTRVKVRLSLRWASGDFVFQQLESGDYDRLVLLGIEPGRVHAWVLGPGDVAGHLDSSTGWLSFPASTPPAWLTGFGPDLFDLPARLH